jgi:hypothetical protein
MKSRKYPFLVCWLALIGLLAAPARAERISFRLSFSTNNISGNDINHWIESTNLLWSDYQALNGGSLEGSFSPIAFGNGIELEIRIPLFKGLALNLAGSRFSGSEEGAVRFQWASGSQQEEQFISNKVSAVPLKIGLSYVFALPPYPKLALVGGFGRHIVFASYDSVNNYKSEITDFSQEFTYLINKQNEYTSESLGYYAHLGAEFDVFPFLSVVVQGEKVWNRTNGFKGSFTYSYEDLKNPDLNIIQKGKASLFLYESDLIDTGSWYQRLAGHKTRPEDRLDLPLDGGPIAGPEIRNVRQGELDFNHISFKLGIRFKF